MTEQGRSGGSPYDEIVDYVRQAWPAAGTLQSLAYAEPDLLRLGASVRHFERSLQVEVSMPNLLLRLKPVDLLSQTMILRVDW